MKKVILIQLLLCISLFAMAQKCKVLEHQEGSITFEVDKDLPAPTRKIEKWDGARISGFLVGHFQISHEQQNILACSFADTPLWYQGHQVLWNALVEAYADHRPLMLSPDVVWEHICLTFSEYVNNHAEEMRPYLVDHQGVKDLVIKTDLTADPTLDILHRKDANWKEVIRLFSQEIAQNTKGDLAKTITADFSTTGLNERVASQITLMDAVKQYFRYIDYAGVCGIPFIKLEGTPADWQKLLEKTQALEKYNMGWWTKELMPILQEFVNAANGKPSRKFWKDIVMEDRPDRVRGGGCVGEPPAEFDGWMLKLFPDTKDKTFRKKAKSTESLGPEMSHVGFKYVVYDPSTLEILEEADIELFAGFVGVDVDDETGILSPKIGWIARKADVDGETLARIIEHQHGMPLTVDEVPTALKRAKQLDRLYLFFPDDKEVVIPEWMDSIEIKEFKIEGKMSEEMEAQLKQRFPKAEVLSAEKRDAHRAKQEAEKAARKAKLAPILAKYSQQLDSVTIRTDYSTGWDTFVFEYDDMGYMTQNTHTRYRYEEFDYKRVSQLDTLGRVVLRVNYDWDNGWVPQDTIEMTYDEAGRILLAVSHAVTPHGWHKSEQRYYYDVAGRLDSVVNHRVSNISTHHYKKTYQYDRKGLLKETKLYSDDELNVTTVYQYDRAKRLISETENDEMLGREEKKVYAYDKQGHRISTTRLYPDGARKEFCLYDPEGDKTMVYEKYYDDDDWQTKQSFTDGEYDRTTAFFYDKDTKISEVMGLETWLKGNIDLLPYANRYGVSQYIPTQIVTSRERDEELEVSTFYYSYIN